MKENNKKPNKTVREWVKFADENFAVAGHELERDDAACHTICFLCQEAAEKYLKAYLITLATSRKYSVSPYSNRTKFNLINLCRNFLLYRHKLNLFSIYRCYKGKHTFRQMG